MTGTAPTETTAASATTTVAADERPPVWTGHVVLYTADIERAAEFYTTIGMRPIAVRDAFAILELRGGTHLAIRADASKAAPGPAPWDLMVEDIDATHEQWSGAGLSVTEIVKDPIHRTFKVTDPDGHVLVVHDSHVVGPV